MAQRSSSRQYPLTKEREMKAAVSGKARRPELIACLELAAEWTQAYASQMSGYVIYEDVTKDLERIYAALQRERDT